MKCKKYIKCKLSKTSYKKYHSLIPLVIVDLHVLEDATRCVTDRGRAYRTKGGLAPYLSQRPTALLRDPHTASGKIRAPALAAAAAASSSSALAFSAAAAFRDFLLTFLDFLSS